MARIRFAHNSFSTGIISKKVQGNTEFEGYNNALDECTNFQVMHTGGVIKRGGTVFVANTKYNKPVKLFPFIYSALESYMCEFGDLEDTDRHIGIANAALADNVCYALGYPKGLRYNADGFIVDSSNNLWERGYIRFYTSAGATRIPELFVPFTLEDLKTGNVLQEGNLINVITKIGLYRIIRENNFKFRITVKDDYINSPKTFSVNTPVYLKPTMANESSGNYTIIVQNAKSGEDPIEGKYYGSIKRNDIGSYLYLKYMLDNGMAFYCLTITGIEFVGNRPYKIYATIYPRFCINCLKTAAGSDREGNFKFPDDLATLNWSVSAFTEERGYPEAAALYERRLFLASNKEYPTGIWGSSMQFDNTMDFTPDNTFLGSLQIKMGSQYTDKILWMIGQSKLFIGTNGGIFMAGAPDEKVQISATNISVRLFDAVSASPLPPVVGGESVFFVDSSEKNVHEIILSSETGMYKANDVSLLANELTSSGIVSHCWTQHPIKTYWCVAKAGHLCALTYLKNNGILAWSKHELAGGHSAKAECVAAMKHNGEDHLWLCINRNKTSGEDNRQIEYMSHSYNSRDVEDCQHYLDSGKSETYDTEIIKIETSVHTKIMGDFIIASDIIARRRNCSVIFEHMLPAVDNTLNKNLPFFIQKPSGTEAYILRDFTYEHEHADIDGNQLSPRDRGMIDPSTFGEVTDANTARKYYYEVASIEDFEVTGIWNRFLKLDTVEFLTAGDSVVIFAWENTGLETISTKRDPANSRPYNEFAVTSIDEDLCVVRLSLPPLPLTGSLKHGKLYKLSDQPMTGYVLGSETAVTCIGRGGTPPVQIGLPENENWTPPPEDNWSSICFGTPQSSPSGIFVAVGSGDVPAMYSYESINWKQANVPPNLNLKSVCCGDDKFVAVGNGNKAAYSHDGVTWTETNLTSNINWQSVCYGNGKYVATATSSDKGAYSYDGITWKEINFKISGISKSVCCGNGKFLVMHHGKGYGDYSTNCINWKGFTFDDADIKFSNFLACFGNNRFLIFSKYLSDRWVFYSSDCVKWDTKTCNNVKFDFTSVCYGNGMFVAVGNGNKAAYSRDGVAWTETDMPYSANWSSICYGNGKFIAVKQNTGEFSIACSLDGVKWTVLIDPVYYVKYNAVCYGDNKFVSISNSNADLSDVLKITSKLYYSLDGSFWERSITLTGEWRSVCYGGGKFVAAGDKDRAVYSYDGITWEETKIFLNYTFNSVCYGGGKFVAVGNANMTAHSADGITWTRGGAGTILSKWRSVCYGGGKFVAAGDKDRAVYSYDGITWEETKINLYNVFNSVCYGNGRFVAVADDSNKAAYSYDGITWEWSYMHRSFENWRSVCYTKKGFLAVSMSGYAKFSEDGITWVDFNIPNGEWESICNSDEDKVIVIGNDKGYQMYLDTIRRIDENERIQLNSVPNMEDICNQDIFVKSCGLVPGFADQWLFTFHDSWSVAGVPQPFDTCDKADYEIVGGNDARMLHYFTEVNGLDHLEGEEVTVISNGKTFKSIVTNGTVKAGKNGEETLFCSVGLQFTASLKTVPLSGGNVTGSSVGCVGSQRSMVLHLFESWGGTYGTSEGEKRPIPYPKTAEAIFNESEGLFTGTVKCPVINGDPTNRCVYIHHSEPTAFSLISMVQDVQVSDA